MFGLQINSAGRTSRKAGSEDHEPPQRGAGCHLGLCDSTKHPGHCPLQPQASSLKDVQQDRSPCPSQSCSEVDFPVGEGRGSDVRERGL